MNSAAPKIVGLIRADDRPPWDNGDRPLAYFDAVVVGIRLNGCTLIRASRGFLLAQPPKGECARPGARAVQIVDPALTKSLAEEAHRVFVALGGEA